MLPSWPRPKFLPLGIRSCLRHSKLELRGPRVGLKIGPRSSGRAHSAWFVRADADSADGIGRRA
eukprot:7074524-Alexandrium_andersonii.AAC.1